MSFNTPASNHDFAVQEPDPQPPPPPPPLAQSSDSDLDSPAEVQLSSTAPTHAIQPPLTPADAETLAAQYPLTHTTPLFAFLRRPHTSSAPAFRIHSPVPPNDPSNLSPYYRMPILEAPASTFPPVSRTALRRDRNRNRNAYTYSVSDSGDGVELGEEDGDESEDEEEEEEEEDVGLGIPFQGRTPQLNHTQPPRAMPPAQSLMLYLWGRGLSMASIGSELGGLDEGFLYRLASGGRWVWAVNGGWGRGEGRGRLERIGAGVGELVRVGAHWEFDDGVAREVIEAFMGRRESWEEMGVGDGGGGEVRFEIRKRLLGRGVERLGKAAVENYLGHRLTGLWVNRDICV